MLSDEHKMNRETQKCKMTFFITELYLEKSLATYKVSLCETVSYSVVRHLLACLTMHKWLVGDVPFYVKFLCQRPTPCKNGDFQ